MPQFHTPPAQGDDFDESGQAHQRERRGRDEIGEYLQQHASGAAHIQQNERAPYLSRTRRAVGQAFTMSATLVSLVISVMTISPFPDCTVTG